MNAAINFSLETVMDNIKDPNDLVEYFTSLELPTLEHIHVCSGIAIQELSATVGDREEFFAEFDAIYGYSDEELVVERIDLLKHSMKLADRKEAMYLRKWLIRERKFGMYV